MQPSMARPLLDDNHIHTGVRDQIARYQSDIIDEVRDTITKHPVVVVGMGINVFPKRALAALRSHGIEAKYLEYGSYFAEWKRRGALKMWTGWPTFPMVFIKGVLIGGAKETQALLQSGELQRMLAS
jgi:monothiol glutaredoxin